MYNILCICISLLSLYNQVAVPIQEKNSVDGTLNFVTLLIFLVKSLSLQVKFIRVIMVSNISTFSIISNSTIAIQNGSIAHILACLLAHQTRLVEHYHF